MKTLPTFITLITLSLASLQAGRLDDMDQASINFESTEPLFVSLGSYCEPAHMMRFCDRRKAAFPLDWVISMDLEKVCELLDGDFERYLNTNDLTMHREILLHPHYLIEFLHDGKWTEESYAATMEAFQQKYGRRVNRFRDLKNYMGKVFFLRSAFPQSTTDPHRVYLIPANLEISSDHAWRLHDSLRAFFPDLDFTLIVINTQNQGEIVEEEPLCDSIRMFRSNFLMESDTKIAAYGRLFAKLYEEESKKSCFDSALEIDDGAVDEGGADSDVDPAANVQRN